jgi:hypothetical protein
MSGKLSEDECVNSRCNANKNGNTLTMRIHKKNYVCRNIICDYVRNLMYPYWLESSGYLFQDRLMASFITDITK